jgi:hypothetical protein
MQMQGKLAGDDMLAATAQRLKTRNRKSWPLVYNALRAPSTAAAGYPSASMSAQRTQARRRPSRRHSSTSSAVARKSPRRGVFDSGLSRATTHERRDSGVWPQPEAFFHDREDGLRPGQQALDVAPAAAISP